MPRLAALRPSFLPVVHAASLPSGQQHAACFVGLQLPPRAVALALLVSKNCSSSACSTALLSCAPGLYAPSQPLGWPVREASRHHLPACVPLPSLCLHCAEGRCNGRAQPLCPQRPAPGQPHWSCPKKNDPPPCAGHAPDSTRSFRCMHAELQSLLGSCLSSVCYCRGTAAMHAAAFTHARSFSLALHCKSCASYVHMSV